MLPQGRFRLTGVLDLSKSMTHGLAANDPAQDFIIKGNMLNAVYDAAGEKPILDDMNWDYFDKHGFVKYEHDPVTTIIEKGVKAITTSTPDPDNIIGAPLKRSRQGKSEILEAALFPGMEKAKKVVKLMKEIRAHNERFPNAKRNMNFSIEGSYAKKSRAGEYSGTVINVVITPNGYDATTCAELANQANGVMAKSLAAGLEISTVVDIKQSKIGSNTMNHLSRQDAYTYALKKNNGDKKLAKSYAETWYQEQTEARTGNVTAMTKSLDNAVTSFGDVVKNADALVKSLNARADDIASMDANMKKSMTKLAAGEAIDGEDFFARVGKAVTETAELVRSSSVDMTKSIGTLATGFTELVNFNKSLLQRIDSLEKNSETSVDQLMAIRMGAMKKGLSIVDSPDQLEPAGGDAPAASDRASILKSIPNLAAQDFLIEKAATETGDRRSAYANAQNTMMVKGIHALPKGMQDELVAHFSSK